MEKEINQIQLVMEVFKPFPTREIEKRTKNKIKDKSKFASFHDLKVYNKKIYRNKLIDELKNDMKKSIEFLDKAIHKYKNLYNQTECWENASTLDFNFEDWNTLRKANGRLTRYYNDILKVEERIKKEKL